MARIVIGVGNRDRGDDGVGIAVAEQVTGPETHVLATGSFDLCELWSPNDDVVIVDAMRSGARPGTVRRFDVTTTPLPSAPFTSTHSFGPATGIELARALGKLPASLVVYGIEAASLTAGASLFEPVAVAAAVLAKELSDA